jgi:Fic family protein
MKKSDLCLSRQQLLVPVSQHPGAFALIPPPTPRIIALPGIHNEVIRAHEALGELRSVTAKLLNPDLITRTLDRREAVRSSQIEGTHSGLSDLLSYEATGSDIGVPNDVLVTLNYVKALDYGLQHIRTGGLFAFNSELIKGLHAQLMKDVREFKGIPGEFRDKQNWIGGFKIYQAKFVPPPAANVASCMNDLEAMLRYTSNEEDQFEVPIVVRMAIAHAQFETIHPFIDGNGRVGRLLPPLMLAAEKYPPIYLAGFLKTNQREYYDALAEVQLQGKWSDWVAFFATGIEVAARESIDTATDLLLILSQWKEKISALGSRSDALINRIPEFLLANPVVTVNQIKASFKISFPSANAVVSKLVELGILVQPEKQQRGRIFVAMEVIKRLDWSPNK